MPSVAVIGAGIAGLSAAFKLKKGGFDPVVLEAKDRVGGVIATEQSDGFLVEHGPNSVQSHSGTLDELIQQVGLEPEKVHATSAARNRFIVRDGRPQAAPLSPMKLATSDLFGSAAKFRLLREPFVPPSDPAAEESVADFVRRRLGDEFLDYGMNPFLAGVYAGDPEKLSIRYALPELYNMEQESGSIVKGRMDRRGGAASAAETHRMYSFGKGLQQLPDAIGRELGSAVRTGSRIEKLAVEGNSWRIGQDAFEAVVFAFPLHRLADTQLPHGADTKVLEDVVYPPLSVVAMGYRREDVGHALDGFGMLVPEVERAYRILGTLFTSSIFPGRAPANHVLLTSFVGGMRNPDQARRPSQALFEDVHGDLEQLLSIRGRPVFQRHVFWEKSIPQYNLGYGEVLNAIERLETSFPGLFMAGNYRGGISVGNAAESGSQAARRCAAYLGSL